MKFTNKQTMEENINKLLKEGYTIVNKKTNVVTLKNNIGLTRTLEYDNRVVYNNKETFNKQAKELEDAGFELRLENTAVNRKVQKYINSETGEEQYITYDPAHKEKEESTEEQEDVENITENDNEKSTEEENEVEAEEVEDREESAADEVTNENEEPEVPELSEKQRIRKESLEAVNRTLAEQELEEEKKHPLPEYDENAIEKLKEEQEKELEDSKCDITITMNSRNQKYIVHDTLNKKDKEYDVDTKYTNKKDRKAFIKNEFKDLGFLKTRRLMKKMDINLYQIYKEYDEVHGTKKSLTYCALIANSPKTISTYKEFGGLKELENDRISYDFKNSKISDKQNYKLMDIADYNQKAMEQNVEVKKPNVPAVNKVFKPFALAMGLFYGTLGLSIGSSVIKDNMQPVNDKTTTIEDTAKEDTQVEDKTVEENNKEEEKVVIGVGSKTTLDNEKYSEVSDGTGKSGTMENKENKEVTITRIAAVNGSQVLENSTDKTIDELRQAYPDATIEVHVESKDGVLGWMDYSEIENKFEESNKVKEDKQDENVEAQNVSAEDKELSEEDFQKLAANWKETLSKDSKDNEQQLVDSINKSKTFKDQYKVDLSNTKTQVKNVDKNTNIKTKDVDEREI